MRHPAVKRSQPAAAGRQLGCFAVDHAEIILFAQPQVAALHALLQLTFADAIGRLADQAAGLGIHGARQVEGVREEIVAEQDARLVVPAGVDRGHMPANQGAVQHVVVDERRGVDHFHHGGEGVVRRRHSPASVGGEEQQRRPQTFAAVVMHMGDQGRDTRAPTRHAAGQDAFHLVEVPGNRRVKGGRGLGGHRRRQVQGCHGPPPEARVQKSHRN